MSDNMLRPVQVGGADALPEEDGRVPVLQTELRYIREELGEIKATLKEVCTHNEQTRQRVLLLERDVTGMTGTMQTLMKNPMLAALGGGGTAAVLVEVVRYLLQIIKP